MYKIHYPNKTDSLEVDNLCTKEMRTDKTLSKEESSSFDNYLNVLNKHQELKKKFGFTVDDIKDQRELKKYNKEVWEE